MKLTTIKSLIPAALAAFALCLGARAANEDKTWMVVDLRTGALSYYGYDLATATNIFNTAEFKTEKMVFRRVPEGCYYVRNSAAVATMGRPYYIGMFPVTVAQYNLMLDPSAAVSETAENLRAIVNVSYATLRGSQNVPTAFGGGLGDGPISRLNTRVTAKLGPFDLPTESMWEVAARAIEAGAETNKTWPWFFGASASPLSQYAFFKGSSEADAYGLTSGSRVPGGKLANAWGLFDIYGNVWERCLDSCPDGQSSETMSLSQVPQSGYPYIRQLGGSFGNDSDRCRTSDGGGWLAVTETGERSGFRLAMISDELPTYTVTLCDDDGTVLATDRFAKTLEGVMPTFYMPSKRAGYYIAGWAQTAKDADNITYTAVYKRGQIVDVGKLTAYTAKDGDMLIGATGYAVTIADGATVTLAGVTITKGSGVAIGCQGDATIILADGSVNTVTGQPGVQLPENADKTLTITVPDDGEGTGALTAIALWGSAAIGQCWYENGHATLGHLVINGGHITANADGNGAGIGGGTGFNAGCTSSIGNITINGGTVIATGYDGAGIGGGVRRGCCGNITIGGGVAKIVATTTNAEQPIGNGKNGSFCSGVTVASNLKQTYSNNGRTLTIEPDVKETKVTVGGTAVGEVVRGEDGKTLSFAVAAGTDAGDVKLDIGGVDVTKGFRVTVNGTEARAVLLAPYEVPKEEGAADGIWTENGDGTVTLNVEVVPGLYYAADSAESIDALTCPGASAPATGATTLTAPKPVGDKGFFKVWVSDAPIPAAP